jgi:3',5'-cyclic-AMP phosphodiesterase
MSQIETRQNRRSFIRNTVFTAGAVSLGVSEITLAAQPNAQFTRWAFLSDTHIPANKEDRYRDFSMIEHMEKVIPQVKNISPDGIAITGDLARLEGFVEDYEVLKPYVDQLTDIAPVCLALGNHDNRPNFLDTFKDLPGEKAPLKGKHVTVINAAPVRLILLDSLQIPNYTPGFLGRAQRTWLDNFLTHTDPLPTFVFVHHSFGENDGELQDAERFFRILQPHKQVKAIFYGHSHRYQYGMDNDIHLINLPSTAYNFNDQEPIGWVEAELQEKTGRFVLHVVNGATHLDGKAVELTWR